jgi:hypothetical protein
VLNITGGTGFTAQRVQILSVSSGIATCDKSCGTVGSSGGAGKLGGAVATPDTLRLIGDSNVIWLKAGTYTLTSSISLGNVAWSIYGYASTHGDNGVATLTTATNSLNLITGPFGQNLNVANIDFTTTAAIKGNAIGANGTSPNVQNCSITGFVTGISVASGGSLFVSSTSITGCSNSAIGGSSGAVTILDSYVDDCGSIQVSVNGTASLVVVNSIIADGSGIGLFVNGAGYIAILNTTIANNGSNGIQVNGVNLSARASLISSIIYGNGGRGISDSASAGSIYVSNNAWGNNVSGNYSGSIPAGAGDVTLSADPFTASASGDYSLNSAAGGGSACKNAGFPGAFPGGTTTGSADIGAVQSGGGGLSLCPPITASSGNRSGARSIPGGAGRQIDQGTRG